MSDFAAVRRAALGMGAWALAACAAAALWAQPMPPMPPMPGGPGGPGAPPGMPAPPGAPPSPSTPAAAASSAAKKPATPAPAATEPGGEEGGAVSQLYPSSGVRDPMVAPPAGGAASAGAAAAPQQEAPEEFSIHALSVKGIMKDRGGDVAILVSRTGTTYYLRKGRLFDPKKKPVAGVRGTIVPAQKKVSLQTPDHDVQILILGEDDSQDNRDDEDQ